MGESFLDEGVEEASDHGLCLGDFVGVSREGMSAGEGDFCGFGDDFRREGLSDEDFFGLGGSPGNGCHGVKDDSR